MSYEWTRGESIDAWKLNLTGKQRQMYVPNQTGLDGGITNASITPADMESSSPYTTGPLYGQQEREKWIGAGTLFYDYGSNAYKVMTGPANVSGVISLIDTNVSVCAKSYTVDPQWIAGGGKSMYEYLQEYQEWDQGSDNTCPPPVWCWQADAISGYSSSYVDGPLIVQDIVNVNPYGIGMNHSQAILPAYVNGWTIPTPPSKGYCDIGTVDGNNGTYQRSSAIIRAVCNCDGSRSLELVNSSDNVIWPVVRPMGLEKESKLDTERFVPDRKRRWAKTHWSPVVSRKRVSDPIIPSYSIGEGGGVFVDRITDKGTDAWSLSIASGIEWYTCDTMSEYNSDDPRPHGTGASVNLGKWGYITISPLNPEHPWQFLLDADLDIGSIDIGSCWDPGSEWFRKSLPLAHSPICGQNTGFYGWSERQTQPPGLPDIHRGIIDGSITRLTNDQARTTVMYDTWCSTFRPGEVINGGIGIATAEFKWVSAFDKDRPKFGCVRSNQNGGLVTGIIQDSPCRPFIDEYGFIHTSDPEWMGKYGVKYPFAHSVLWNCWQGQGWPLYTWTPPYSDSTSWHCVRCGIVNGKIQSVKDTNIREEVARQPWQGRQYMYSEVGEYNCGRIGIATAVFDPTFNWWNRTPPSDVAEYSQQNCLFYAWNTAGGLVRGIFADISLCEAVQQPPYIDCAGNLHVVYVDAKSIQCNDYSRKIKYKQPEFWQGIPPN